MRKLTFCVSCVVVALVLSAPTVLRAQEKAPEDVMKEKGLQKVNALYLLEGDAKLGESLRAFRMAKKTLDDDTKKRNVAENQLKMAKGAIGNWELEYRQLNEKLAAVKDDAFKNNQLVGQINALVSKIKEGTQYVQEREAELKGMGSSRDAYVTLTLELSEKMDAMAKQYEALAKDAEVQAALTKINDKARPKMKIGPSPELAQNLQVVRKQRETINSAVVKVNTEGNVPHVDVTINGKVTRSMILDSGASTIALTAEMAKALGMTPGPNDPTVRMQLADGKVVEAKQMMLRSVKVGQFLIENVECAVLPESLVAAENLLGNTFLRNFVYKIDHEAGELHLNQIGKPGAGGAQIKKDEAGKK